MLVDHRSAEFHDFFERHHAELARFAWLLTGEADAADDLAAEEHSRREYSSVGKDRFRHL